MRENEFLISQFRSALAYDVQTVLFTKIVSVWIMNHESDCDLAEMKIETETSLLPNIRFQIRTFGNPHSILSL